MNNGRTLQHTSDKKIKFDIQHLVLIESRKKRNKSDSGNVLITISQKQSNDKRLNTDKKPQSKIKCFECHKLGHYRKYCRKYKVRIAKEQSQDKSTEANQTYSTSRMFTYQSVYMAVNGQDS